MSRLKTGALLGAAILMTFAGSYATGRTQPRVYVAAGPTAEAGDTALVAREGRLLRLIQVGRLQGWLDRDQARTAYGTLRRVRERQAQLRAASAGRLTAADRAELDAALDDLAQDLHWARLRNSHSPYRPH